MTGLKQLGETGLIERLRSRLSSGTGRLTLGIGDDCAAYAAKPGNLQLISTDALIENVHFDLKHAPPHALGRKSIAVNVSDIAAMGGTPVLAVISLGIPKTLSVSFLDALYQGIDSSLKEHGLDLAGGDTVASPKHLFINVTIVGEVRKNRMVPRDGAKPGDAVWVTGYPGESALGLKILQSKRKKWLGLKKHRERMIQAHLDPTPRLAETQKLLKSGVRPTAMMDVSDGLAQDLHRICDASGAGALIREPDLPQSAAMQAVCAKNRLNIRELILSGGEDYEILFTTRTQDVRRVKRQFHNALTPVTLIGEVTSRSGNVLLESGRAEQTLLRRSMGFQHFQPGK